jgi:predicted Zn-dependent protease
MLARATSYLAIDKTKEAAADLDEAVQADPNSALAWTTRGEAYEKLGDKAKAAASYTLRSRFVPGTKPRAAGWRAPAVSRSGEPSRSGAFWTRTE